MAAEERVGVSMWKVEIEPHPHHHLAVLTPGSRGRLELDTVEIYTGAAEFPEPFPFEGVVITADLQGIVLRATKTGTWVTEAYPRISVAEFYRLEQEGHLESVPVGLVLPEVLVDVVRGRGIAPERVLALLCGDLFGTPERGGSGDVSEIWYAFEGVFGKVVGVLGNHDLLPPDAPFQVLDGKVVSFGTVRIGGVSGVIGNPSKPNRKDPKTYRAFLLRVLRKHPEVVMIHECPSVRTASLPGRTDLAEWLQESPEGTLICTGHVPWQPLMADLPPHRVLNVEHRVVILKNQKG